MFTFAPVASSAFPNSTSSPPCNFAVRPAESSDITFVFVRSSTPFSSYHPGSFTYASFLSASPRRYSFERGGRSYGGSGSLPTTMIEPPGSLFRSSAAQLPAAIPPPINRYSALTLPHPSLPNPIRAEVRLQIPLALGVEHRQHLVPRLQHRVGPRHESSLPLPQDADQERPIGHVQVPDPPPRHPRVVPQQHLDDLQPLLGQIQQVHQPVLRHLVLDHPQDQVRSRHVRLHPQQLEVGAVPRVINPRDDPVHQVLLLRHLADQHVVLVVAGHRDHHVGARDPSPLQHPQLRGVPVLHAVLELLLHRQVAVAVVLDQGHLVPLVDQLPRQVPPDLPRTHDDHVLPHGHQGPVSPGSPPSQRTPSPTAVSSSSSSMLIAERVGQIVLSPCFSYHSALNGSRILATTVGTL